MRRARVVIEAVEFRGVRRAVPAPGLRAVCADCGWDYAHTIKHLVRAAATRHRAEHREAGDLDVTTELARGVKASPPPSAHDGDGHQGDPMTAPPLSCAEGRPAPRAIDLGRRKQ